jgi:hypothetical protein
MEPPSADENEGEGAMESGRSGVNEDPFSVSEPITTIGAFSTLLTGGGDGHWSTPWPGSGPWFGGGSGSYWPGVTSGGLAGVGQWPCAAGVGLPGGAPWSAAGGQGHWFGLGGAPGLPRAGKAIGLAWAAQGSLVRPMQGRPVCKAGLARPAKSVSVEVPGLAPSAEAPVLARLAVEAPCPVHLQHVKEKSSSPLRRK